MIQLHNFWYPWFPICNKGNISIMFSGYFRKFINRRKRTFLFQYQFLHGLRVERTLRTTPYTQMLRRQHTARAMGRFSFSHQHLASFTTIIPILTLGYASSGRILGRSLAKSSNNHELDWTYCPSQYQIPFWHHFFAYRKFRNIFFVRSPPLAKIFGRTWRSIAQSCQ